MEHFERNETNRIHAGAGSNGHAPKGGGPRCGGGERNLARGLL